MKFRWFILWRRMSLWTWWNLPGYSAASPNRNLMSDFDHSRYRDNDRFIDGRPLLQSHGVSRKHLGAHECFSDGGCDWILRTISDLAFYFCVDEFRGSGMLNAHWTSWAGSVRLIHKIGRLLLRFRFRKRLIPTFHGCSVVRGRPHCRVARLLHGSTEKALRIFELRQDVGRFGAGS